ncbi:MAG: TolC family protein [Acidobacteria bacterium]|nr:TolC family protein [Acidobacteriota bacterium]
MTSLAKRLCVLCGLSLILSGTAAAQEAAPLRLLLEEAQSRAVAVSHRLAEGRARAATADAVIAVREAADRPIVALGVGYTRTNHVMEFVFPGPTGVPRVLYPDAPDNYRTRIDLQWPIYSGGRLDALERAARAEASAAAADVAAVQGDLRLEVARAFWALVTARATAAVLDRSLARAQAHVNDVRQRLGAGLVPPNEVASAEAQESRQRMLLIETRNQRDVSSAELARLVGVDLLQPIEPAATLDLGFPAAATLDLTAPSAPTQDGLVAEARAMRDERVALAHRITAADEQRAAAEGSRRPVIAVTGGVDYARPNPRIFPRAARWDDSWDVGVAAAWSLWDGGRARAEAAQAGSVADAARQRLAEFDSILALEVRQRTLEIDSGRAAVAAAQDGVRAAAEARRVVTERYRVGVVTQAEVLDADEAVLQAELDRTRAMAGVRFAEARLARALGR